MTARVVYDFVHLLWLAWGIAATRLCLVLFMHGAGGWLAHADR